MRFGLLGPLTVHDGEGVRSIEAPKVRALLAVLLLHPDRPVRAGKLKAALWGAHPPATADASLKNHVWRLRQALPECGSGEQRIRAVQGGYLLRVSGAELDTEEYTRALQSARTAYRRRNWEAVSEEVARAMALWRGDPLPDLADFDEAQAQIELYTQARWQALEWRVEAELALGRHDGLAPELGNLIAEQPLREPFHRQLMLVLHRTGRQEEALAVFGRLRRTLIDELGVEPGVGVQEAHREILRARAASATPPPASRENGGTAPGPAARPPRGTVLRAEPAQEVAAEPIQSSARPEVLSHLSRTLSTTGGYPSAEALSEVLAECEVLVIGHGPTATAIADDLRACGIIRVFTTPPGPDQPMGDRAGRGLVIAVDDQGAPTTMLEAAVGWARLVGYPVLRVAFAGEHVEVGPTFFDGLNGCPDCLGRSRSEAGWDGEPLSVTGLATKHDLLTGLAVAEALALTARLPAAADPRLVTRVDPDTRTTDRYRFMPYPDCAECGAVASQGSIAHPAHPAHLRGVRGPSGPRSPAWRTRRAAANAICSPWPSGTRLDESAATRSGHPG